MVWWASATNDDDKDDEDEITSCTLHRLPTEIRHDIFRFCLQNSSRASTPPLIAALRPETLLYHEALDVFYGTNRLEIRADNLIDFARLSKRALGRVLCAQVTDGFAALMPNRYSPR